MVTISIHTPKIQARIIIPPTPKKISNQNNNQTKFSLLKIDLGPTPHPLPQPLTLFGPTTHPFGPTPHPNPRLPHSPHPNPIPPQRHKVTIYRKKSLFAVQINFFRNKFNNWPCPPEPPKTYFFQFLTPKSLQKDSIQTKIFYKNYNPNSAPLQTPPFITTGI